MLVAEQLDQLVEGDVLVGQGFQRVAAHLLEQLLEAHAALHRVAHHHRVDQRADQAFGVEVTPVRDWRADGDRPRCA